jgi:hypothetical protein
VIRGAGSARPPGLRALALMALLALLWAPPPARAAPPEPTSAEELDLLARSLRPEGRRELEAQAGPLAALPLSEVEAEVDLAAAQVTGRLRLVYTHRQEQPLRDLVLRLYPSAPALKAGTSLTAEQVAVDGAPAKVQAHGSVLEIALPAPLQRGGRVAVTLAFKGRLRRLAEEDDALSIGALGPLLGGGAPQGTTGGASGASAGYGTFAVSPSGATLVDWYPQLAARVGDRWDVREPGSIGDASRADPGAALVTLTFPRGLRASGSGAALGQHAAGPDKEVTTFAHAGLRGVLALALLRDPTEATADVLLPPAGALAGAAARAGPAVHLRASSLHGKAGAEALLACARDALVELSRRLGPYPFSDLALAEVPLTGGAGGVELPGLALIARALAEEGAGASIGAPPGMLEFTCHHEVAHQWFPALVGSDPRGAPWVDEALAQHLAGLVAESTVEGAEGRAVGDRARSRFVALNYQGLRMLGRRDGKVARPADAFKDPLTYAGLVYGKAPYYFLRVRDLLGDAHHDAALRALRAKWAFREAPESAPGEAFAQEAPARKAQLAALDQRYLREAHGDEDLPALDTADLLGLAGGAEGAAVSALLQALGGAGGLAGAAGNQPGAAPSRGKKGQRGPVRAPRNVPGLPPGLLDDKALQQALREMGKTSPELRQMLEQLLKGGLGAGAGSADEE